MPIFCGFTDFLQVQPTIWRNQILGNILVNENGIVTPIEVNAAVAAFVAAQKHQNQRLEGSSSGNLNPTANGVTNVVTSLGSSLKQSDLGSKITKPLPSSSSASISNVSNV